MMIGFQNIMVALTPTISHKEDRKIVEPWMLTVNGIRWTGLWVVSCRELPKKQPNNESITNINIFSTTNRILL